MAARPALVEDGLARRYLQGPALLPHKLRRLRLQVGGFRMVPAAFHDFLRLVPV